MQARTDRQQSFQVFIRSPYPTFQFSFRGLVFVSGQNPSKLVHSLTVLIRSLPDFSTLRSGGGRGGQILRLEVENFKSHKGKQAMGPFFDYTAFVELNAATEPYLMDAISFALGLRSSHLHAAQHEQFTVDRDEETKGRRASVGLIYHPPNLEGECLQLTRTITGSGRCTYRVGGLTWGEYNDQIRALEFLIKARHSLRLQSSFFLYLFLSFSLPLPTRRRCLHAAQTRLRCCLPPCPSMPTTACLRRQPASIGSRSLLACLSGTLRLLARFPGPASAEAKLHTSWKRDSSGGRRLGLDKMLLGSACSIFNPSRAASLARYFFERVRASRDPARETLPPYLTSLPPPQAAAASLHFLLLYASPVLARHQSPREPLLRCCCRSALCLEIRSQVHAFLNERARALNEPSSARFINEPSQLRRRRRVGGGGAELAAALRRQPNPAPKPPRDGNRTLALQEVVTRVVLMMLTLSCSRNSTSVYHPVGSISSATSLRTCSGAGIARVAVTAHGDQAPTLRLPGCEEWRGKALAPHACVSQRQLVLNGLFPLLLLAAAPALIGAGYATGTGDPVRMGTPIGLEFATSPSHDSSLTIPPIEHL
ncbi:hypothetical protein HU200_005640 [Digitaria exilis]|uniref:Uncharacterized protein n=1 Tax=Digitaria exilis TaxID=1010633 RepID=A0A835FT52_9POAL|nr:hypothetical protein HU200_005640 [Digitaria exilis]